MFHILASCQELNTHGISCINCLAVCIVLGMHADDWSGVARCHKAKNLMSDAGGKPSKIAQKVL